MAGHTYLEKELSSGKTLPGVMLSECGPYVPRSGCACAGCRVDTCVRHHGLCEPGARVALHGRGVHLRIAYVRARFIRSGSLPKGEALGERIRRRLAVDPVASGAPLLLPKGVDVPTAIALVGGEDAGPGHPRVCATNSWRSKNAPPHRSRTGAASVDRGRSRPKRNPTTTILDEVKL